MKLKKLPALLLLICVFTVHSLAGTPEMPPAPAPTPVSAPVVQHPSEPSDPQTSAEATTASALAALVEAITTLLAAAL